MRSMKIMLPLLLALLLAALPAFASTCLGESGVVCKPQPVQTELTAAPLYLPPASATLQPGYTLHLDLSGPAVFDFLPDTGLVGDNATHAVYVASPIAGIGVRLTDDAYIGDVVLLQLSVVDANGSGQVVEEATFDAVQIIGFSHKTVATFNPGSNTQQQSLLRLVAPGNDACLVHIVGTDDAGRVSTPAEVLLDPGHATLLPASLLETGGAWGVSGGLGDGVGKWRLAIDADCPGLVVQSLMRNTSTGTLSNLSGLID